MNVILWSLIGLFIGLLANRVMHEHKKNTLSDLFLSVLGAVEAGYVYHVISGFSITQLIPESFMMATGGAIGLLLLQRFFANVTRWSSVK